MSFETLEIGASPGNEECEKLGANFRPEVNRKECWIFSEQIRRVHGDPPEGAEFKLVRNECGFGVYYEIGIKFDDRNEAAMSYAFGVENDAPTTWDRQAMVDLDNYLREHGHPAMFTDRLALMPVS